MRIAGQILNYATSEEEAWAMLDTLVVCENCIFFKNQNLFGGVCSHPGTTDGENYGVDIDDKCEEFQAKDKKVDYWINKLAEMAQEYNGSNDFNRQFAFHEKNGTLDKFLGLCQ